MMTWQERYTARFYRVDQGWVDGTTEFHALCKAAIPQGGKILEIGPGPSNPTSRYLATLGELHGLDPDPDSMRNDSLKSASLLTSDRFPFEDGAFNACVSNYVVEHVADPQAHLREVKRVLSPGGAYVVRTPNLYHYVALVGSVTPHWFHKLVANRLRGLSAEAHDPYPTFYALNTAAAFRRRSAAIGLRVETLRLVEKEPSYGMSSRVLFFPLMAYERLVNATELAKNFRSNIFVVLRKDR
jgi:SAM-dependent methyltransferase